MRYALAILIGLCTATVSGDQSYPPGTGSITVDGKTHFIGLQAPARAVAAPAVRMLNVTDISPGDYWLRVTSSGVSVTPMTVVTPGGVVTPTPPVDALAAQIRQQASAIGDSQTSSELAALASFVRSQIGSGLATVQDVNTFWEMAAGRVAQDAAWEPVLSLIKQELGAAANLDACKNVLSSVEAGLGSGAALGDGFLRDLLRDLLQKPEVRDLVLQLILSLIRGGGN